MGNFKIMMAVIVAIFLGYKFLYKNDHPNVPSNETVINSLYKFGDPKHENNYKVNNCKVLTAGFGKETSYSCNITITSKNNSRPTATQDVGFINTKDGLFPENF